MAIRPRGAAFQADAFIGGARVRRDFPTRPEAEAWVAEAAAAKARSKVQSAAPPIYPERPATEPSPGPRTAPMRTIGEAVDRTFARHYAGSKYELKLRLQADVILDFWGRDRALTSIDNEALDDLVAHLKGRRISGATINRYLAVVSKVLTFACPRAGIIKPRVEREPEAEGRIRWLSGDEERGILAALRQWGKDDHADAVTVLIDTGMRCGELWKLEARDVDLKAGAIRIWMNKTKHPRSVYMTPRVRTIMEARLGAVKTGRLFPYADWWLRPAWDRARHHLGMTGDPHFIPYICRHTCASRLVQRGVSLAIVGTWLGHKSMQMTMRYAHLSPANLKDAAAVLAQAGD